MPTFLKITKAHVKRIFNNLDSWVDVLRIDEYSAIGNPAVTELSATAGDITTDIPAYQGATYTLNWQDDPANVTFPQDSLNTNRKTDMVKVMGPDPGPDVLPETNTITVLAIKKTQVKDSTDGYQQPYWNFHNLSDNQGRKVWTVRVPHTDLDPSLAIAGNLVPWADYLAAMNFNSQDARQFVDVEIVQTFGTFSSVDDWQVAVNNLKNQNKSIAALFPASSSGVRLDPFQTIVNCGFFIPVTPPPPPPPPPVEGLRFYLVGAGANVSSQPIAGSPFAFVGNPNPGQGQWDGTITPASSITFSLSGPFLSLDLPTSLMVSPTVDQSFPPPPYVGGFGSAVVGIETVFGDPGSMIIGSPEYDAFVAAGFGGTFGVTAT